MHGTINLLEQAREHAYSLPLDKLDPSHPELFRSDTFWPYFDRLRKEAPVHYCDSEIYGPFWSITKYNDIMEIETNHQVFSSDSKLGGITIRDQPMELRRPMFIAMDEPHHSAQRRTVAPMFTPTHLDQLAINIRERSASCLDSLPRNETFDWVDKVSIELTTQMLAVLFDFPWDDRRKLTRWSDVATTIPGEGGVVETEEQRQVELMECAQYFKRLWDERIKQPPKSDLISMMAHAEATRNMDFSNLPRQPDPADRRRQRHHPQHAVGQHLRAEQVPRSAQEAEGESGAARQFRAGGDPLADAAGAHAPHGARGHRVQGQDRSRRATRS